jgi:hypothetical protein
MATYIGYVFWGLLLVILDVTLNQFDVLPDFIGYILVAIGAGRLVATSSRFGVARDLSWALMAISIVSLFVRGDLATIIYFIGLVANCTMMWFLLGGFAGIAAAHHRQDLAEKAAQRRVIYVVLMVVAAFVNLVGHEIRDFAALAVVVVVVAMLVLTVMILHLIHQLKTLVAQTPNHDS